MIVATIDDELAGYVLVVAAQGSAGCAHLLARGRRSVRPPRRRPGAAAGREAYARRHRRAALTLEVRYDNASAIALYESCGFRQFGEHAHYYADGATALRYEKSLLPAPQRETGEQFPA